LLSLPAAGKNSFLHALGQVLFIATQAGRRSNFAFSKTTLDRLRWGDRIHGQTVRQCFLCSGTRERHPGWAHRLRSRSVRVLRPTCESGRLVRYVRADRLLLSRWQPALFERQLPLGCFRPALALPALPARLAKCLLRTAINTRKLVDCTDFSHRRGERAPMFTRPFGLRRRALGASLHGGPAGGSLFATYPTAICGRRSSTSRLRGGNMQASLKAVLCVCALALSTTSYGFDCCSFFGLGAPPCGGGNGNCCDGCEPDRWIPNGPCFCGSGCGCGGGCDAGCGCESSCGCAGGYCTDGRSFAGQKYTCGCRSYFPTAGCTGPMNGCEPACGCSEADCGCEASCGCGDGCEPSCGCGCPPKVGCLRTLSRICGRMRDAICGGGSCGCSGEVYWSEWHNDPPRCCDPCNRCGQWVGPSAGCSGGGCSSGGCSCGSEGGFSEPIDSGSSEGYYSNNRPTNSAQGGTNFAAGTKRPQQKSTSASVARTNAPSTTKARAARKPQANSQQPTR